MGVVEDRGIEKARTLIHNFILDRNRNEMYVRLNNIMMFGNAKGYSKQDVGFVIQSLKEDRLLSFSRKRGWVAR
tara:strand:- start:380 stop:601 length:222 start_codon:yes stop_codon:yes gene_type:complete